MTKKELAAVCIARLKAEYPESDCTLDYDHAWQLLVSVRLAAQCTDARVNVVVQELFARFPDWPPVELILFGLRGTVGALAVIAAQLLLAMVLRSFAVPIFLAIVGGIVGMLLGSKGYSLFWPYCLMQAGMNANRSEDILAGQGVQFAAASAFWLAAMFVTAYLLLKERDVKA